MDPAHEQVGGPLAPEGLPLRRLAAWLDRRLGEDVGPLRAAPIVGGRSNLTYRVQAPGHDWVLRRPPVGAHLATAHDVAREFRVMAALQGTDVPVPRTRLLCEDDAVIGAPFYLMDFVPGLTYRNAVDLEPLGAERTRTISERLVDTLALVHAVDLAATGLDGMGRPDGFLARQVGRWRRQLEAAETPHLTLAARLHGRLEAAVPTTGHIGLVHGDFRLDNVLVSAQDQAVAVIDWELATIGDTLTDVALMVVYQRTARLAPGDVVPSAAVAPGYLGEDETLDRYRAACGYEVADLGFHLALASFKLAGIIAGIDHRYRNGQLTGPGVAEVGEVVPVLLRAGLELL